MEEFAIKSVNSASGLRFFGIDGDYFRAELKNPEYSGAIRVWAYTDSYLLADLFQGIAEDWRGWQGERKWASIEGEFAIAATSDRLGHVSLVIEMRHGSAGSEPWRLTGTIAVDAGQLDAIARDAKRFFKA